MKDKNGQFQLLHNCSFEQDIYDTSMEHDGISTKPYPKKLIAYIRGGILQKILYGQGRPLALYRRSSLQLRPSLNSNREKL